MTNRITKKDLETIVLRINLAAGTPTAYSGKRADGKFAANVGNYHLSWAYGGVKLVQTQNEVGGIRNVTQGGYRTKKELYFQLLAYLAGIEDCVRSEFEHNEAEGLTTSDAQGVVDAEDMKHTPAPWTVSDGCVLSAGLNDYGNWHVAKIQKGEVMTPQDNANARLIAAAPELLADLERAIELLTQVYGADQFIKEARETLSKATGRS